MALRNAQVTKPMAKRLPLVHRRARSGEARMDWAKVIELAKGAHNPPPRRVEKSEAE